MSNWGVLEDRALTAGLLDRLCRFRRRGGGGGGSRGTGARSNRMKGNWNLGGGFEEIRSGTKDLPQFSSGFD